MLIPSCGDEKDEQRKAHRDLLEEMANFFKRTYLIEYDVQTLSKEQENEYKSGRCKVVGR